MLSDVSKRIAILTRRCVCIFGNLHRTHSDINPVSCGVGRERRGGALEDDGGFAAVGGALPFAEAAFMGYAEGGGVIGVDQADGAGIGEAGIAPAGGTPAKRVDRAVGDAIATWNKGAPPSSEAARSPNGGIGRFSFPDQKVEARSVSQTAPGQVSKCVSICAAARQQGKPS